MIRIAVCDDDINIVKEISQFLHEYEKNNSVDFEILGFYDGDELLVSNQKFDLIFLDIEMERIGGFEAADGIREFDMNLPIVYITSHSGHFERAFKVHAFEYITKPIKQERLLGVMNDFFAARHDVSESIILLLTSDGFVNVKLNEVYYFFAEAKKRILMHTVDDDVLIYENLADIYNKLDKTQFYMTKRGSVVNLRYVKRLKDDRTIIMKDDYRVSLAITKKEEFIKKLSSVMVDKLKGQ